MNQPPPGVERALLTDLYELTMAAAYHGEGHNPRATFDLYVRSLPERRNFLVACGLEPALEYLETLAFQPEDLDYLRSLGFFDDSFLELLGSLEFTGEVRAIPEGEAVFADEPLMSVTAPLIEAQIVETYLINCVAYSTLVATKAARVALACGDRSFVDFSPRRVHGADAAMFSARSSFVGGAVATSNVAAGKQYGIQLSGTMAHSFVMAFKDEASAFKAFARRFPERAVLLIDTYDTVEGARVTARVADELSGEGIEIRAVRIDSGDLAHLTNQVRKILDESQHSEIEIFLSGDLDEYRIDELVSEGVPVDAFGVGTQMGASADSPTLSMVYKLVETESGPVFKLSPEKETLPGAKQVYRFSAGGQFSGDLIASVHDAEPEDGQALLETVMEGGKRNRPPPSLESMQDRCRATLRQLPESVKSLRSQEQYPVKTSESVRVKT